MKKFLILILIACIHSADAQYWVEAKKEWMATFSQELRSYSKVYDFDGNRFSSPTLDHYVSELRGEYAITSSFSACLTLPFIHNAIYKNAAYGITENKSVNHAGDVQLALSYMLRMKEHLFFSVFYRQSFATAETDAAYGMNTGYGDNAQHFGMSIRYKTQEKFYSIFDIGYKLRHKGFGDEIIALAELGYCMSGRFWILGRSQGIQPLENGDDNVQGGDFGLFQQYEGSWNTGLGLRYNLSNWDFTGVLSGNFKGQFSPAAPILTLEVRYKFLTDKEEGN